MIFITLGNQNFQFNRLLNLVEKAIEEGVILDEVVAQTGYTSYQTKLFKTINFLEKKDFNHHIENSKYVISHAGTGSIINCLKRDKKVIVAARLSKYDEHIDDHQVEILNAFAEKNYIIGLDHELKNFRSTIKELHKIKTKSFLSNNNIFNNKLNKIIDSL